jgi:hypothetical protein
MEHPTRGRVRILQFTFTAEAGTAYSMNDCNEIVSSLRKRLKGRKIRGNIQVTVRTIGNIRHNLEDIPLQGRKISLQSMRVTDSGGSTTLDSRHNIFKNPDLQEIDEVYIIINLSK